MRYRALLTDYAWHDVELEREILAAEDIDLDLAPDTDAATLTRLAPQADAILTCWAPVTAPVIQAASRCRIISRLGIGLDNIDVAAATERRMIVTNVPDYCVVEVAEHTLALLLSLARNLPSFDRAVQQGHYTRDVGPPLRRLAGQTLGLIGYGAIGQAVAERALGLKLNVLVTSRIRCQTSPGVTWCELEPLLAASDFVSLHLPLTPASRHLIGAAQLAQMKPSAFLLNTARGALVDHQALAAALANNQLAGAALDVQDPEPPDLSVPPYNDPRVLVTPHTAFVSQESLQNLRTRVCHQIAAALQGRVPEHVVNPEVL
jgi:D-3-phosphoglycerate dehydrogenase